MNDLFFYEFVSVKKLWCDGCKFNSPSQKDHSCLYSHDDQFYMKEALNNLLKQKKISDDEYFTLLIQNNLI